MIHFVTHFDEYYAAQGLAMIESLRRFVDESAASLNVFSLTDECHAAMKQRHGKPPLFLLASPWRDIIRKDMTSIESARSIMSWKEFCWLSEPAIVQFALKWLNDGAEHIIVYVDADQFFFADPIPSILAALETADVALSPHHFPPGRDKSAAVGRYNFGVAGFRACEATRKLVREWLEKTLANCDEHTAGHQRYLDGWPAAELPQGVNCAPWQQVRAGIGNISGGVGFYPYDSQFLLPLISWHFHEFRRGTGRNPITLNGEQWNRSGYDLHPATVENVYLPYERELVKWL